MDNLEAQGQDHQNETIELWQRFKYELNKKTGIFDLNETYEENARKPIFLYVERCFAPCTYFCGIPRVMVFCFTLAMYLSYVFEERMHRIFFASLTTFTFTVTCIYQLVAIVVTFNRKSLSQPEEGERPSFAVMLMWSLYSTAYPTNVLVVLLFWFLDYPIRNDKTLSITTIYPHGITSLFIMIDGNFLSTIPIRAKQFLFSAGFIFLYILWSLVHNLAIDVENEVNENAPLYTVIDWNNNAAKTAAVWVIIVTVVIPIIFTSIWALSHLSKSCLFDGSHRPIFID